MTVHFRGKCLIAKNITCLPAAETHYNTRQPYLTMRGFCQNIKFDKELDLITII